MNRPSPALERRVASVPCGEYSTKALYGFGIYADILRRALRDGLIERVERGVYRIGPPWTPADRERAHILAVLRSALGRGYTAEQLREWIQGAVEMAPSLPTGEHQS